MTDLVYPFDGWGRGGWGDLTFGQDSIPAFELTSTLGSETITAGAVALPTGVVGTSAVGDETIVAKAVLTLIGASGTSALGSEVITAGATPTPTSVVLIGTLASTTVWGPVVTNDTQIWKEAA